MKRRVSAAKKIVAVALAATVAVSLTGCKKRKKQHQCGKFGRDYKPKSGSGSGNAGSDCHTCTDGYACTDRHAR